MNCESVDDYIERNWMNLCAEELIRYCSLADNPLLRAFSKLGEEYLEEISHYENTAYNLKDEIESLELEITDLEEENRFLVYDMDDLKSTVEQQNIRIKELEKEIESLVQDLAGEDL